MQTFATEHSVLTSAPPVSYRHAYEQLLYHKGDYLTCQQQLPDQSFWICKPNESSIHGMIHFHIKDRKAISQLYSPFGSYHGKELPRATSRQFIESILNTLAAKGINEIEINHPSEIYTSGSWGKWLLQSGFSVRNTINHHIKIFNQPLERRMHQMERRKLTRCRDFNFSLYSIDHLSEIYDFIQACREERAHSLSLTFTQLERIVGKLPHHFLLCAVRSNGQWAAASIVIKVCPWCWYQFYPAHRLDFNKESPLVLLINELYKYARTQGVTYLDLGTSEIDQKPIKGLIDFKERMGGVSTLKTTYTKLL